jgi:hypothetical protein
MRFSGNHSSHYHLYTDNQAAEHIATQPTMSEHSRSIDLRHHSIRQDYLGDLMRIGGVSSKDNTSDILTKYLQPDLHTKHTTSLLFPDRQGNTHTQQDSNVEQQESSFKTHLTHPTSITHQHHNMVTYIHIPRDDPRDNPTLRQARQQWADYLTQHNKQQTPPPLPITSNEARHNPSLRQARQLWTTSNNTTNHLLPQQNLKLPVIIKTKET